MQHGIAIIFTDARHMPNGAALPFHTHHRQSAVAASQLAATPALKARLWQAIAQAKILNQAGALQRTGRDSTALVAMARLVQPGDPENVEARAARHYWSALFADFVRDNAADLRNAMLNYAYAVLRAAIARALTASGLLPCVGLHHASDQNAFNLADDLIEPFRPIADHLAWRLSANGTQKTGDLTRQHRQILAGVLLEPARVGDETVTTLVATEMAAAALVRAYDGRSPKPLLLPTLDAP